MPTVMSNSKEKLSMLFFDLAFFRRALIKVLFWTSILIQSRKSQNVLNFWGYVFKNRGIYIYIYTVKKSQALNKFVLQAWTVNPFVILLERCAVGSRAP